MSEIVRQRGRAKGQVKQIATIKDPLLGKYHIEIDENSFNVIKEGNQNPIAYCTSLGRALYRISANMVVDNGKTHDVRGYIIEIKQTLKQFEAIGQ